jgi:hypothetical protein
MQIIVLLITLVGFSCVSEIMPTDQGKPVIVEVRCGGDDNLTQGVCRNVYNEFASTADFVITDEDNTATLIVYIPTNVNWKQRGKRTRVFYKVEFLSNNEKQLSKKKGECWDDDFKTCASQVLKHARSAARKLKYCPAQKMHTVKISL